MRILYSTHGISLKLFSGINENLINDKFVSDSAFIVSNKFFYEKSFLKKIFCFKGVGYLQRI